MKNLKKVICLLLVLFTLLTSNLGCANNNELGDFYTLKEAYLNGFLTDDDLIVLANYYHGEKDPLSKDLLTTKQKKQIVKSYLVNEINEPTISNSYVNIYAYYGTYNGVVAMGITDTYFAYDLLIIKEYQVGSITFYNYSESYIRIWVSSEHYNEIVRG